jgi:hypothetical protein
VLFGTRFLNRFLDHGLDLFVGHVSAPALGLASRPL